jgi:hypothetical protein
VEGALIGGRNVATMEQVRFVTEIYALVRRKVS